jgi:hypothetical protein
MPPLKRYKDEKAAAAKRFRENLLEHIQLEYGLSRLVAERVYAEAYKDGHSAGEHEVALYCDKYAEFAKEILAI